MNLWMFNRSRPWILLVKVTPRVFSSCQRWKEVRMFQNNYLMLFYKFVNLRFWNVLKFQIIFSWFFNVLQWTKNVYRHNRIFKFQYFSMFSKHVSQCYFKVCSQSYLKWSHYNNSCEFAKNELQNFKLRS